MIQIPIGIDLGTTCTCVCAYKNNQVITCLNKLGKEITPSYIEILEDKLIIGDYAKNNITSNTFYNIKRFIGKAHNNIELINDLKFCIFDHKLDENNKLKFVTTFYKNNEPQITLYNPEEICGLFLKQVKEETEAFLNQKIKECVITVPAYFNNKQRELTKKAGEYAGFTVLQIINEPTSAALTYGLDKKEDDENILIFDWGGGTLDTSILELINGVIEVKNTDGDIHLGGEDIDNNLVQYCLTCFIKNELNNGNTHNINIQELITNKNLIQKLRIKCEESKKILSVLNTSYVCISNFWKHIDLNVEITRDTFIKLNEKIFNKCRELINKTINTETYKLDKNNVKNVVLIGGSTKIPEIMRILKCEFPNSVIYNDIDPDTSVAYGACIHCNNLMSNCIDNNILIDVVSHSIGVEVNNCDMNIIIPKNTIIPCSYKQYFTTHQNNQRIIKVKIYEGEDKLVKNNLFIREILIDNLPPKPIGELKFELEFKIDENNILSVLINGKIYDIK